jgi:(R)-amidase
MRVALAQFTPQPGDIDGNLARMLDLLAAARRADLVCFPELSLPGYLLDPGRYTPAFLGRLARAARELEDAARARPARIVYGTADAPAGALRNVTVLTSSDGQNMCYAKTHMVSAERLVFSAGDHLVLDGGSGLGLGCCYDLAFPGFGAALAEAGARVLIFPMAWEGQRAFVFEGVVAARAIENVAYVVCVNQAGRSEAAEFYGGSRIVDPLGHTLLEMGATDGLASADLDLDWVGRLRSSADPATYPLLTDRRPPLPVRVGSSPPSAGSPQGGA